MDFFVFNHLTFGKKFSPFLFSVVKEIMTKDLDVFVYLDNLLVI